MTISSVVAAPVTPLAAAPAILAAANLLLPHLERGQCVDATVLRAAMEKAFGASDASGAWDWKLAYEACEVTTVLFLRRYGRALFRNAKSPVARLDHLRRSRHCCRPRPGGPRKARVFSNSARLCRSASPH